jgi:porin
MVRTTVSAALAAVVLALSALAAFADGLDDWLSGDHATGDWGGVRTQLEDWGITLEGAYTTDTMAVRNSNAGSGDGWDYAGRIDFGVDLDLEKLAGIPGFSIYASGAWSSGQDLSERKVGNIFAVQQIYTDHEIRLSQLYAQQRLLDDQLTFKLGRLTTEEDFLASDIYTNYVKGGINGVPGNVPGGNFSFTTAPFAQWGVVAAVEPIEHLRLAVGVYNADEKTIDDRRNGTRFTLDPEDGVFAIGEVSYAWHQPRSRRMAANRPSPKACPASPSWASSARAATART